MHLPLAVMRNRFLVPLWVLIFVAIVLLFVEVLWPRNSVAEYDLVSGRKRSRDATLVSI